MIALPKAQSLLVTENTAVIRSIARVIREVDLPPAGVIDEFITLERADAQDVLEKLIAIFERKDAAGAPGSAPVARPVAVRPITTPEGIPIPQNATAEVTAPNSVEISAGTLSEDSLIVGQIKLTADVRTNRIHVVTRPINMPFIRKLLREFDADVKFGEPSVRNLRFVSAADVLDAVVTAITDPGAKVDEAGTGAAAGRGGTGAGGGGASNRNQDLLGNRGGNSGGGQFGGGNGGGFSLSESLSTEERPIVPLVKIVGNTKIIADTRANSIVVLGNESVKEKVFRTLDLLDRRQPQVMMHTIIGELTLSAGEQFGVDYILRNGGRIGGSSITAPGTGSPGTPALRGTAAELHLTSAQGLFLQRKPTRLEPKQSAQPAEHHADRHGWRGWLERVRHCGQHTERSSHRP
jgi:hypothetical protein